MKPFNLSALICPILVITLFSCKKDHTPAPPAPPAKPADSTIHVNYIYQATAFQIQADSVKQVEIILNEENGKVLLDTIAAVNTNIVADLKTTATSFDLTVIRYRPVASAFYMVTEKTISPAAWTILPGSDSLFNTPPNVFPTYSYPTIYYTHVPVANSEPYMWNTYSASVHPGHYTNYGDDGLYLTMPEQPDADDYLVFPNKALYNFHHQSSAHDTVDLSRMDTAVRIRIARPAQYPNLIAYLNGFVDPTNVQKNMHLSHYISGYDTIAGADLVYPGKRIFQKYNCSITASDASQITSSTYSDWWGDTVNAHPILLDDSYYALSATQNNNFSVSFLKLHPSYYSTGWHGTKVYWTLNAPTDTTQLHPLDLLNSLRSKMLAGQDLSTLKLLNFEFYYQLDQNKQPVPAKLTPPDGKFRSLSDMTPQVSFSRVWQ